MYYSDYKAFDGMTVALVTGSRQDAVLDQMEQAHGFFRPGASWWRTNRRRRAW